VETTFNSRTQLHLHQDAHLITSYGSLASSAGHRRHDFLYNNDHLDRDADEDHHRLKSSRCHLNLRKLHELHDRNRRNILSVSVREPNTHRSIELHGRSIKSEWHVRRRRKRPGYDRCRAVVTYEFHDGLAMTGCFPLIRPFTLPSFSPDFLAQEWTTNQPGATRIPISTFTPNPTMRSSILIPQF
jgi:hypothetical protein